MKLKFLNKKSIVRIKVFEEDRTVKEFKGEIINSTIKIPEIEQAFITDNENFALEGGMVTYYYNFISPYPLKLSKLKEEEFQFIDYSPSQLYSGLESKLMQDAIGEFTEEEKINKIYIILFISILIFILGVGYILYDKLNSLIEVLL